MNNYSIKKNSFLFFFGILVCVGIGAAENKVISINSPEKNTRAKSVQCSRYAQYGCSQRFSSKGNMRIHFRAKHLGLKPYICPNCGQSFAKRQNLLVHRKTHKNVQGFKCPICSRSFSQKGNMKRHLGTHNKTLNFKCDWCERKFKCNNYKVKHQKTCKKKTNCQAISLQVDSVLQEKDEISLPGEEYLKEDTSKLQLAFSCAESLAELSTRLADEDQGGNRTYYDSSRPASADEEEFPAFSGPINFSHDESRALISLARGSHWNTFFS